METRIQMLAPNSLAAVRGDTHWVWQKEMVNPQVIIEHYCLGVTDFPNFTDEEALRRDELSLAMSKHGFDDTFLFELERDTDGFFWGLIDRDDLIRCAAAYESSLPEIPVWVRDIGYARYPTKSGLREARAKLKEIHERVSIGGGDGVPFPRDNGRNVRWDKLGYGDNSGPWLQYTDARTATEER